MKISFKKKSNPHRESLERRIQANEAYLETMVAGTKEYKLIQKALKNDYDELRKMDEPKVKLSDVVAILGVIVSAAGIGVNLATSLHRDKTRKDLGELAFKKEEIEGELKNGTDWSLAAKE